MNKPTNLQLLLAIAAIASSAIVPTKIVAAPSHSTTNGMRLAQLFYPPASDRQIIAVAGQGYASLPADIARIYVYVTNSNPQARNLPTSGPAQPTKPQPAPAPITEASLANIVNALKAAGVSAQKIKVTINPLASTSIFSRSNSSIEIELEKPTQERVDRIVKAANDAKTAKSDRNKVYVNNVNVQYLVNSCQALENAAYLAAMKDAKMRADALAKSMGVQLTEVPSVAELPFLGRFYSPCSQNQDITGAILSRSAAPYNPSTPAIVGIYREIAVTYRVR